MLFGWRHIVVYLCFHHSDETKAKVAESAANQLGKMSHYLVLGQLLAMDSPMFLVSLPWSYVHVKYFVQVTGNAQKTDNFLHIQFSMIHSQVVD